MVERRMLGRAFLAATGLALLFSAGAVLAQSKVEKLQSEFDAEQDPIKKAKRLAKLGNERVREVALAVRGGRYGEATETLNKYIASVETAMEGLKDSQRDAEKKPAGFKQMQIHVRKSIRKIADAAGAMPFELRESFNGPLTKLNAIDAELIELLFPKKPTGKK